MSRDLFDLAAGPPPFQLLRGLCHASFAPEQAVIPPVPLGDADWATIVSLAAYHRVEGLVVQGLGRTGIAAPARERAAIEARARQIAAENLRMARECERLSAAFTEATIPILFVKGLTLATIAYGTLSTKTSADIDIAVPPAMIAEAARRLRELGYRPQQLENADAVTDWHRHVKESLWIHEENGTVLDLHSRLAESPQAIPHLWPDRPTRTVDIGHGIALPTLGREELATYLAVHGVSSAWFRLKWIADFAALLEREHEGGLVELRRAMVVLGAHHMGDQALLLSDSLFDTLRSEPGLRTEIARNRAVRRANAIALSYLHRAVEPTAGRGGTIGIHAAQLLLLRGMKTRLAEAWRKMRLLLTRRPA